MTVHDGVVTGWRRFLGWGALLAAGVVLVGLGVCYGVTRLDEADKWGSVIGASVALIGLPMTGYGIVLARRQGGAGPGGQSVSGSVIGGGINQVRGVRGTVRIGSSGPVAPPEPAPGGGSSSPAAGPGAQSVGGSSTAGPVRQVDDVGGDVDIDR